MIHIDIDSLTALRYFYNGETLGISKEEISRNEKQRKLLLPAVLKEFLLKYGSLGVNFGEGNVLPPDLMRIVDDKVIFAYMDDQAMLALGGLILPRTIRSFSMSSRILTKRKQR